MDAKLLGDCIDVSQGVSKRHVRVGRWSDQGECSDGMLTGVVKLFEGAIGPVRSFEPDAAFFSLSAAIASDGVVLLLTELIVSRNMGPEDAEENEVIDPFGDRADPFCPEYVSAGVRKVAVNAC